MSRSTPYKGEHCHHYVNLSWTCENLLISHLASPLVQQSLARSRPVTFVVWWQIRVQLRLSHTARHGKRNSAYAYEQAADNIGTFRAGQHKHWKMDVRCDAACYHGCMRPYSVPILPV